MFLLALIFLRYLIDKKVEAVLTYPNPSVVLGSSRFIILLVPRLVLVWQPYNSSIVVEVEEVNSDSCS